MNLKCICDTTPFALGALATACLLALPFSAAQAATIPVTNCNESGAGSLRDAVANAASGDVIDLRQTNCNEIELNGQAINITQKDLELRGPGPFRLALNADTKSAVLNHSGSGTLKVFGLSIELGRNENGGCIYSNGQVNLERSEVRHCQANNDGGGIYSKYDTTLINTSILRNKANNSGGGVAVEGYSNLTLHRSKIVSNVAKGTAGGTRVGSQLIASYSLWQKNEAKDCGAASLSAPGMFGASKENYRHLILASTVSDNQATEGTGGVCNQYELDVVNSTFSGNKGQISALYSFQGENESTTLNLSNSTFAFNESTGANNRCAAILIPYYGTSSGYNKLNLDSNILANNTCNGAPGLDLDAQDVEEPVTGSHNLIARASGTMPSDTITADPKLAPLADNGGIRQTHALQAGSPAIDAGANPLGLRWDQRWGQPRTKGAQTDIGAYEY